MTLLINQAEAITKFKVFGFDTETNSDSKFSFGYCISDIGEKIRFNTRDEAIDWLNKIKKEKTIVCGLNVAYDLNTLFPKFNPERILNKGRFISCKFKKLHHGYHVKFIDVGNFIQQKSMKQIANLFKFDYIDIHDIRSEKIDDACITHAQSAAKTISYIQDLANTFGVNMRLTAPSLALQIFKTNFLKPEHQIYDNPQDHNKDEIELMKKISLQTYHGAATEVFKKGIHEGVMVDVISMYPIQMKNHMPNMNRWRKLKSTEISWFISQDLIHKKEGMAFISMNITDMLIPPFIYQSFNQKNVSKSGTFQGWLNFVDIRYCIELGIKITYSEIFMFDRIIGLFDNYVDYFYNLKKGATKQFAKLMLNSLYGKFGEKPHYENNYEEIATGSEIDIEEYFKYDGINFHHIKESEDEDNEKDFPPHSYPLIASYITSYARVYLHRTMMKIGTDKIIYCDTDSIFYEGTIEDAIKKGVNIGNTLGCFELKWIGKIDCIRPKMYRYKNKELTSWQYVIKGISQRYQEEFWKNGFNVWISKPRKYFTAIRRGKQINEWVCSQYSIKPCIQKRIFDKKGNSRPYLDNDIPQII